MATMVLFKLNYTLAQDELDYLLTLLLLDIRDSKIITERETMDLIATYSDCSSGSSVWVYLEKVDVVNDVGEINLEIANAIKKFSTFNSYLNAKFTLSLSFVDAFNISPSKMATELQTRKNQIIVRSTNAKNKLKEEWTSSPKKPGYFCQVVFHPDDEKSRNNNLFLDAQRFITHLTINKIDITNSDRSVITWPEPILIKLGVRSFIIGFPGDYSFTREAINRINNFFTGVIKDFFDNCYVLSCSGTTLHLDNPRPAAPTPNAVLLEAINFPDTEIPEEFLCALTMQIMNFPTKLKTSGVYVDRMIFTEQYRAEHIRDPFTKKTFTESRSYVDMDLKYRIENFVREKVLNFAERKVVRLTHSDSTPYSSLRTHICSPITNAGDTHNALMREVTAKYKDVNNPFSLFVDELNKHNYNKALRIAATSTDPTICVLIDIIMKYKDELNININEPAGEKQYTALHQAGKRGNSHIYYYLVLHGANETIKDADGKTARDLMEDYNAAKNIKSVSLS